MATQADVIRRRLRAKIDGRPGGSARAVNKRGRTVGTSGRRSWVVEHALTWRALGYENVEISFLTPRRRSHDYKPFPVTQAEAIACVRELAQRPLGSQWRRLLKRLEAEGIADA